VQELKFLGYILNKNGVSLDKERIQALIDAPIPNSCTDGRGILGGLQMLRRFDPRIAECTNALNAHLQVFLNGPKSKMYAWDWMPKIFVWTSAPLSTSEVIVRKVHK
jgi:hypothetical protein